MADLIADLKRLRLYGMAACYVEGLEQGQAPMTTAASLLAHLVQAETTDRATRSIRYQMHVARLPGHRDVAGFDFTEPKVDGRQITGFATTTFTEQADARGARRRSGPPPRSPSAPATGHDPIAWTPSGGWLR